MKDIQIDDDIRIRFTQDVILEIYEHVDPDLVFPVEETFDFDDEAEVYVLDRNDDGRVLTVQFPDGSVTFLNVAFIEVVEVNP